jgi:hypothetical protein
MDDKKVRITLIFDELLIQKAFIMVMERLATESELQELQGQELDVKILEEMDRTNAVLMTATYLAILKGL